MDRELLAELTAKLAAANVRLVSVQPFLVAAFNRLRSGSCAASAAAPAGWWSRSRAGSRSPSSSTASGWRCAAAARTGWRSALPELIQRESAFLALSEPCTRVIVCAQDGFDPDMHEAFRTEAVDYGELALGWSEA